MHIAYFGGLFDGEGYVGVSYRDWDKASTLIVTIVNNHRGVLELCKQRFGGEIVNPPSKGAFTWRVVSTKAMEFLKAIQPYTLIKRPQIDLALKYPIGQRGKRVEASIHIERRAIKFALMRLKKEASSGQLAYLVSKRPELEERTDVQEATRLYEQGMTAAEIGAKIGENQSTVAYWMRSLGINRSRSEAQKIAGRNRSDSIWRNPDAAKAKEMYQAGTPINQIARDMGRRPATVNAWLRKMGVTRSLVESQRLRRQRERSG